MRDNVNRKKVCLNINDKYIEVIGKGYFDDELFDTKKLASILSEFSDLYAISNFLKGFNGFYSVYVNLKEETLLAVDHVRSIPLFYKLNGEWGYSAFDVVDKDEPLLNTSVSAFIKTGWTIGNSTLYSNVYQVTAGQHVIIHRSGEIEEITTFSHHHDYSRKGKTEKHLKEELWNISCRFTQKAIDIAGNRQIVVPLSGGYDSRYIVAMLKHLNVKNVILISYGRRDSFEIATAKQVAKKLGYRWIMVDYNADFMKKYITSNEFKSYCAYASGGASLPHIQEFPLLSWLHENKKIPENAIFMPGFCGDFLGGSYIPSLVKVGKGEMLLEKSLSYYIFDKLFYLDNDLDDRNREQLHALIESSMSKTSINSEQDFCSSFEAWFTHHKLSKFVVNAVRAYEYFGYDWYLPLWDHELTEFWYAASLESRVNKKVYDGFLLNDVFQSLEVDFRKEHSWLASGKAGLIRPYIPNVVKKPAKLLYYSLKRAYSGRRAYDPNGFQVLSKWFVAILEKEHGKKIKLTDNINQAQVHWFLEELRDIRKNA